MSYYKTTGAKGNECKIITISMPKKLLDKVQDIIDRHDMFFSRSELIRTAISDFVDSDKIGFSILDNLDDIINDAVKKAINQVVTYGGKLNGGS